MEPLKGKTADTQRSPGVLTKQQRIAAWFCESMFLKNRMRANCSYGSVGESAGNRRLYPEFPISFKAFLIFET